MLLTAVLWGLVSRLVIGGVVVLILAAIMNGLGVPPTAALVVVLAASVLVVIYTFIRVAAILEQLRHAP